MRTTERVLTQLMERTGGRCDRTVHIHRHITRPLHLSEGEVATSVAALQEGGLIEADPMLPELIRLTARMGRVRGHAGEMPSAIVAPTGLVNEARVIAP
jgi:hypothetical protein